MFVDIVLLIAAAVMTVGFAVLGVYLATDHPTARKAFIVVGTLLLAVTITQGVRQILSQSSSDETFMKIQDELSKVQRAYDQKVDGLFALLQTNTAHAAPPPKLVRPTHATGGTAPNVSTAQAQQPQPQLPPSKGTLTVTQSSKPSTRADAPYETEVVVQTSQTFTSLKFAMQCDKPIIEGHPMVGSGGMVQMNVRTGILKDHPNVFVYSYGSSVPPFDPANPLVIDVWSKEPVICNQAATF